jgi:hypothetical protein
MLDNIISTYKYDNLLNRLDRVEYFRFDFQPSSLLELKNGNIMVGSWLGNMLAIYDCNFHMIRHMPRVNNRVIWPSALAIDQAGNVFVTDVLNNSIVRFNKELVLISQYQVPREKIVRSIIIYKEHIYVCMLMNKRIDVMTLDFDHVSSHYLEVMPFEIKIGEDDVACVIGQDRKAMRTCFYRMPTFDLIIKHDKVGCIMAYDKMFYMYNSQGFSVFDRNGNLRDNCNKKFKLGRESSFNMVRINNSLFMCTYENKICKIKII